MKRFMARRGTMQTRVLPSGAKLGSRKTYTSNRSAISSMLTPALTSAMGRKQTEAICTKTSVLQSCFCALSSAMHRCLHLLSPGPLLAEINAVTANIDEHSQTARRVGPRVRARARVRVPTLTTSKCFSAVIASRAAARQSSCADGLLRYARNDDEGGAA